MKQQTVSDKIENCLVAIDMIRSLPSRAVDLSDWKNECGSVACLGGWVAQHPHFMKKGVRTEVNGRPTWGWLASWEIANELFGNDGIFSPKSPVEFGKSSKQAALDRLNAALEELLS